MITAESAVRAASRRKSYRLYDFDYHKTEYIPYPKVEGVDSPQAFLIEQAPLSELTAHFHLVNQYQVIVQGDGWLGKHKVGPISVHYADGHTPYGPIIAGEQGLSYFTLRAKSDVGLYKMPDSREQMKRTPRRFLLAKDVHTTAGDVLRKSDPVLESIIEKQDDGIAGFVLRMGPNQEVSGPDPGQSGGQYYLILNGELIHGQEAYPKWSCVFVSHHDGPLKVRSGMTGLEALILQYPIKEAEDNLLQS